MIQTYYKTALRLLILAIAVSLSSCADYSYLRSERDARAPATTKRDGVETDLQLVEIEPEIGLTEELVELSKTGNWGLDFSPVATPHIETVTYDFPVVYNKQVEMYLELFQTKQKKTFARWLSRSTAYKSMMEKELAAAGLPLDLVYLSMIESGYSQLAYSRAKAVGLWQFMKGTGKQYHLKIDTYVDERRDAVKSTRAAVAYLGDLYKDFGDWYLAVAAYNAGPGKMRSGLRKHNVDNFWALASKKHLRLETKRYVPKLIAALIIAKEPEKYGFTNIVYQSPLDFDTIKVGPGMSLDAIALISNSNVKEIRLLNAELQKNKTPLNVLSYRAKIPSTSATIASKNLSRLHSIATTGYKSHKVRTGETLTKVCRKYGVNKTTILKVNNINKSTLVVGQYLRIPFSSVSYQLLPEGSTSAMATYKDSLILHKIKPGDSVSKIAMKYNVPRQMIVEWNGLKSVHAIRAGQQLALYIDNKNRSSKSQPSQTITAGLTLKADKKKIRGGQKNPFQWYNVKRGDSLWTISRQFSASPTDIKKWNNLKSNLIHPGNKLRLKKG